MASLNSMGNKIVGVIDKNATLIGAGALILEQMPAITDSVSRLLGGYIHAPDFNAWKGNMLVDSKLHAAIVLAVGAPLVKGTGSGLIDRIASAAGKAAQGYVVANLAADLLYFSTHSPGPDNSGGNAGYSYGY